MKERKPWTGVASIVRFNWPFFIVALVVWGLAFWFAMTAHGAWLRYGSCVALLGTSHFLIVALGVSHLVYDRSDLYRWRWLQRIKGIDHVNNAIACYTGFDDSSVQMHAQIKPAAWYVLDHFNPVTMSEPSIQRARKLFPPHRDSIACAYDAWPADVPKAELIIGFLAIHEMRCAKERGAWFCQAKQHLAEGGKILIIEHTRNWANFLAFGPGFLHFHSSAAWRRSWGMAELECVQEFDVTPWIRVFVLIVP